MAHHVCRLAGALGLALLLGACAGGGGEDAATTTTTLAGGGSSGSSTSSSAPDRTPFCESVRGLESLGNGDLGTGPEAAVAQSEAMLDLLDQIAASAPDGSPAEVEALIDDFRGIAEAMVAAGGDAEAAYADLRRGDPGLYARLSDPNAHKAAFEFFAARCGTPLP